MEDVDISITHVMFDIVTRVNIINDSLNLLKVPRSNKLVESYRRSLACAVFSVVFVCFFLYIRQQLVTASLLCCPARA